MLVVADVIEICCPGIVVERHQIAPPASRPPRILNTNAGPLVSHAVSSFLIHCTRTGPSNFFCQIRRLEPRIVGGGAAVRLRAFHPDDAHLFAWDTEKLRHAGAHPVDFMSFE